MTYYAGFDTSVFPGAQKMAWLKTNTNLVWCGYYLAPAPSHPGTSWMGQRASLQAAGWGIAPVYVGQQLADQPGSHVLSAAQGSHDGANAASLLQADGFAAASWVYLDLENGPPFQSPQTDYVAAWIAAVAAAGFNGGVYCSHAMAAAVAQLNPTRIWAFKVSTTAQHAIPGSSFPNPAPSGSGYSDATIWQLQQNGQISLGDLGSLVVDLSSALSADPSK